MRRRAIIGGLLAALATVAPAFALGRKGEVGGLRGAIGSYAGDGTGRLIATPFDPIYVYLASRDGAEAHWLVTGSAVQASLGGATGQCFPTEGGFRVAGGQGNAAGRNYTWVAFG